jgi:hypothetical protein
MEIYNHFHNWYRSPGPPSIPIAKNMFRSWRRKKITKSS